MPTHSETDLPRVYETDEDQHLKGNGVYYDRLKACVEAASQRPIDWTQVEVAITYDRVARSDGWIDADPQGNSRPATEATPVTAPTGLVTESVETLSEVLAAHRLHPSMNICTGCDWRATPGDGSLADQHEAHRVAALIAAGAVRPAAEPDAGERQ